MALTKYNYNSFDVTPVASKGLGFNSDADGLTTAAAGSMVLIKTLTSDGSDSDLTFVDGTDDVVLDSTYPIYKFVFINIHPETDEKHFQVGFRDGGSSYDAPKTTTFFRSIHSESDTVPSPANEVAYSPSYDLAQSTSAQYLMRGLGNQNDESGNGELLLFNPSSTTFVKHFIATTIYYLGDWASATDGPVNAFVAGYCNVTAAIDGVQFSMSGGEIQGGKIKLYGISDS